MNVKIPIGDVFDKHSILKLKKEHCIDNSADGLIKLKHISTEYDYISRLIEPLWYDDVKPLYDYLYNTNKILWNTEDLLRQYEKECKFDEEFINLSRTVYTQNDIRCTIKKKINILFNSEFIEEKIYESAFMLPR